jgi:hypothetical protein
MPDLGCLRDSASSGQKRIFAIVFPPIPTPVEDKTIRRIVIFDNHPDSLRLVLKSGLDLDSVPLHRGGKGGRPLFVGLF